jgi:hypothetical protein
LIAIVSLALAVPVSAQQTLPPVTVDSVLNVAAGFMGFEPDGTPVYAYAVHLKPHDTGAGGGFLLAYSEPPLGGLKIFWRYEGRSNASVWVTKTLRVPAWFGPTFGLHLCFESDLTVVIPLSPLQKPDYFAGMEPYGFVNLTGNPLILHANLLDPAAGAVEDVVRIDVFNAVPFAYGCFAIAPVNCATPMGRAWLYIGPEYAFVLPLLFQMDEEGHFAWQFKVPPVLYGVRFFMQAASHNTKEILLSNAMMFKLRNPDGTP